MSFPLVTIITPSTPDREHFNQQLASRVRQQDYPNIEHLFLFDVGLTIGEKRNILCTAAQGEIIVHMDSDDMYAHDWVSKSVEHLLRHNADLTGINTMYLASDDTAWLYKYNASQPYVCGATMCYKKSRWEKFRFRNISTGEDTAFCYPGGRIVPHKYITGFIARIHGANTASHHAVKSIPKIPYSDLPVIK